jgi:hypothetical protein
MSTWHRSLGLAWLVVSLLGCAEPEEALGPPLQQLVLAADAPCTFTEVIAPATFDTTERVGVSADGRVLLIGTRPVQSGSSLSWLAEIVSDPSGKPAVTNLVAGTLGGTQDGKLGGAPVGDACLFSGMAVHGNLVYAACYTDARVAFLQVDLTQKTVRAGDFTTCNGEPSATPCASVDIYPNGMAVDPQGRIYASSMLAYVNGAVDGAAIVQIEVGAHPAEPGKLSFRYRPWAGSNFITDGIAPNGVQIESGTLYYAAGADINAVPILPAGKAGRLRVQYHGIFLTYIDDFFVRDRSFVAARTLPGDLAEISPPNFFGISRVLATCRLPRGAIPSSVTRMPVSRSAAPLFAEGAYLVTAYYGGGFYTLNRLR